MSETCEAVILRTPQVVVADNIQGRDLTHPQVCGRPVERDGLCSACLRRRESGSSSRFARAMQRLRG
jgi:hypothetical protein